MLASHTGGNTLQVELGRLFDVLARGENKTQFYFPEERADNPNACISGLIRRGNAHLRYDSAHASRFAQLLCAFLRSTVCVDRFARPMRLLAANGRQDGCCGELSLPCVVGLLVLCWFFTYMRFV